MFKETAESSLSKLRNSVIGLFQRGGRRRRPRRKRRKQRGSGFWVTPDGRIVNEWH